MSVYHNYCLCHNEEKLSTSETSTLSERVCVAAKQGCIQCLLNYRGIGTDFNHCFDGAQRYPLHYACMEGREAVIELLLQSGAMLEVTNAWSATPLYAAAKYGHLSICKRLISINANMRAQNNYGATPLYIAADRGHTHVVRELIRSRCDINHMVHFGATPLKAAAKHGHSDTVRTLVAYGAEVTCDVLLESLRKRQLHLTKYFLQNTDVVLGKITQLEAKKSILKLMYEIQDQRRKVVLPILNKKFPESLCKIISSYDLELVRNYDLVNTLEMEVKLPKSRKILTPLGRRCKILQ